MSKKDFQNGFALGFASGGVVEIEKEEQEKSVNITENGTTEVTPDKGMALSKVTVNVAVESGGIEEIENIIDQSEVLDSTEGTVEDKVGALIDYANFKNIIQESLYANNFNSNLGYISVFRNTGIKDVSMFDFSKTLWLSAAFQNTQIEELEIDIPNVVYIDDMCMGCKNLKRVVLKNMGSAVKSVRSAFYNNFSLESVGILNFEGTTNTSFCFSGCNSLRDVSFVPETIKISIAIPSPVLSDDSIKSILRGLAYVETMQTLKLNIDVYNRLIFTEDDEMYELYDKAVVEKGWDIAY
jgi:hypothetical protein